eukprot:290529-Hanusia_phi.AAC.1
MRDQAQDSVGENREEGGGDREEATSGHRQLRAIVHLGTRDQQTTWPSGEEVRSEAAAGGEQDVGWGSKSQDTSV